MAIDVASIREKALVVSAAQVNGLCDEIERLQVIRDQLYFALKTIIQRGYKIEVSDYYTAESALKAAEGANPNT